MGPLSRYLKTKQKQLTTKIEGRRNEINIPTSTTTEMMMMRHPLGHEKINTLCYIQTNINTAMPYLGPSDDIFTGMLNNLMK